MNTDTHQLLRTIDDGKNPTIYRASCGYQSTKKREFRTDRQPIHKLTCETCIQKLTGGRHG